MGAVNVRRGSRGNGNASQPAAAGGAKGKRSKRAAASAPPSEPPASTALGHVDGLAPSADPTALPDFGWAEIDHVRPWVQNPRKNARAVGKVADSIRRWGWGRPLVINMWPGCEGELIVGHTAWLAALELKLDRVPVRIRRMEPAAAHALAIADNKLGEISDWDPDELGRIIGSGEISGGDLALAGFSDAELEALKNPPAPGSTTIAATTECKCPKCGHEFTLAKNGKRAREAA